MILSNLNIIPSNEVNTNSIKKNIASQFYFFLKTKYKRETGNIIDINETEFIQALSYKLYAFEKNKLFDIKLIEYLVSNNHYFSKNYGFRFTKKYFISTNYNSLKDYFDLEFGKRDYLSLSQIKEISSLNTFKNWIKKKQETQQLIEYEPNNYISIKVFKEKGFKNIIKDISEIVEQHVEENKYFTINSLSLVINFRKLLYGFTLFFVESILKNDKRFNYLKIGTYNFFVKIQTNKYREVNNQSFIEFLVPSDNSIELEDLLKNINNFYCSNLAYSEFENYIKSNCSPFCRVYYNKNREKLYGTYNLYLKETKNETITDRYRK